MHHSTWVFEDVIIDFELQRAMSKERDKKKKILLTLYAIAPSTASTVLMVAIGTLLPFNPLDLICAIWFRAYLFLVISRTVRTS